MTNHVVIEAGHNRFEIWKPCDDRYCGGIYHQKVAACERKRDAEQIARLLDEAKS